MNKLPTLFVVSNNKLPENLIYLFALNYGIYQGISANDELREISYRFYIIEQPEKFLSLKNIEEIHKGSDAEFSVYVKNVAEAIYKEAIAKNATHIFLDPNTVRLDIILTLYGYALGSIPVTNLLNITDKTVSDSVYKMPVLFSTDGKKLEIIS